MTGDVEREIAEQAEFELNARRAKMAQILAAQSRDSERMAQIATVDAEREARTREALDLLEAFRTSRDARAFAHATEQWCRRPGVAFVGPNGQMFLKQLVNAGRPDEIADLLVDALTVPVDDDDAVRKLTAVLSFIDRVKQGGHPAPGRTPFLLSTFWHMQNPAAWPVSWPSAMQSLSYLGWLMKAANHADTYLRYATLVRSIGDPRQVAHALFWFDSHRFVGLSPHLLARCRRGAELRQLVDAEGRYLSTEIADAARTNAIGLIYDLWLATSGLQKVVAEATEQEVSSQLSGLDTQTHLFRWWGWASWRVSSSPASIRLHMTEDGLLIALSPGHGRVGWFEETGRMAEAAIPEGYQFFQPFFGTDYGRITPTGKSRTPGDFLLGRLLPGETGLDSVELADQIRQVATDMAPLLNQFAGALQAPVLTTDGEPVQPPVADDALAALANEFREQRPYPFSKDEQSKAARLTWAAQLSRSELEIADTTVLKQVVNSHAYGSPGPQSRLNATLNGLDGAGLEDFFRLLDDVLWSPDALDVRLDRAFAAAGSFPGLGESVLVKLLAIVHPERMLPVFPFKGDMGKARLMQLVGLTPPGADLTRGQRHAWSNDALRDLLDPHFPGDTWAQAQFLYWLRTRPEGTEAAADEGDPINALAEDLHLPADYLSGVRELLLEKRQLVFFGPPGTGKTYVARKLAELVAGNPQRVRLVQFHPSTSYEDFFEGYRPEVSPDGQLTYRLVPGPLARMAAEAEQAPALQHVLVIDEINRANLPKVLGELLFLLEYRGEQAYTLYRPDDPFELPPNLLVIGTMNTADRSIALIDAALRRRFGFVRFFPDVEPHNDVLRLWLTANNPSAVWVADLVDDVNRRLIELLGGSHLQIGPSHFFDPKLDVDRLRRVWEHNVEPFIEDQLWGRTEEFERFRFDKAVKLSSAEGGAAPPGSDSASLAVTSEPDESFGTA